jgi:thymidylate synthase (FAD)
MAETKRLTIPAAEEILGLYFSALDHGFVSLVDYMGGDEAVEDAARTSHGPGNRKVNERRGLIRHLRRHMHTTPSEMVELKFHCSMPIFVARQWVRHRTANVNEYSGRYSVIPMLFYTPSDDQFRKQSAVNKQGRGELADQTRIDKARDLFVTHRQNVRQDYEWLIQEDFARELARIDLPLSAYTMWYWKIDLHNLMHFLTLRCDHHAQYEIRVSADIMAGMAKRVSPISFEAWVDYNFAGARMSRMEMEVLREFIYADEDRRLHLPSPEGMPIMPSQLEQRLGSKREVDEFLDKLKPKEIPSFDLDLSSAKTGEYYATKWAEAVPKVDRS